MKCYEIELVDDNGTVHKVRLMTDNPDIGHIEDVAKKNLFEGKHIQANPIAGSIREVDGI